MFKYSWPLKIFLWWHKKYRKWKIILFQGEKGIFIIQFHGDDICRYQYKEITFSLLTGVAKTFIIITVNLFFIGQVLQKIKITKTLHRFRLWALCRMCYLENYIFSGTLACVFISFTKSRVINHLYPLGYIKELLDNTIQKDICSVHQLLLCVFINLFPF